MHQIDGRDRGQQREQRVITRIGAPQPAVRHHQAPARADLGTRGVHVAALVAMITLLERRRTAA